jgi:3-oxoadipate enol-lactonase
MSDPVLVLSNPIGTKKEIWDAHVPVFRRHFRVLTYDTRPRSSIAELGTDVLTLLNDCGVDSAAFCGVSLGGMTGLWLAANAPDRISSLVVACTALVPMPDRQTWLDRAALVRADGMAAIADIVPPRWFTPGFLAREPRAVAKVMDMLLGTDPETYAACGSAIADLDLRPLLPDVKAPALVISGEADPAAPPWMGAQTARAIPGAHLRVLRGASHLAHYETPAQFTAAALAHLTAPSRT